MGYRSVWISVRVRQSARESDKLATVFRIITRTPEEKADLAGSWARPDEEFFSAGACHILAGVFLEQFPAAGFHALMLKPAHGFRGGHVVATDMKVVFDCRGWNPFDEFLRLYQEGCRRIYPGWTCTLEKVEAPLSWEFARDHGHRHPTQYFGDPLPRARAFLHGFPPASIKPSQPSRNAEV